MDTTASAAALAAASAAAGAAAAAAAAATASHAAPCHPPLVYHILCQMKVYYAYSIPSSHIAV